jgi:hypothetical protein
MVTADHVKETLQQALDATDVVSGHTIQANPRPVLNKTAGSEDTWLYLQKRNQQQ